eukprot:2021724-Prymnesium_polylepis.1
MDHDAREPSWPRSSVDTLRLRPRLVTSTRSSSHSAPRRFFPPCTGSNPQYTSRLIERRGWSRVANSKSTSVGSAATFARMARRITASFRAFQCASFHGRGFCAW